MNASSLATLAVLALVAATSPFSLIAFSVVLATDRGTRNGGPFILGWITTVMLIGLIVFAVGGAAEISEGGTSGDAAYGFEIGLGVVLLTLWVRHRLRGPVEWNEADKPVPRWQQKIETMGAGGAFVLGGAIQTWPAMIAGGTEIAHLPISTAEGLLWMFGFACATTTGIVTLQVLALRSPGSAAARLERIRNYIARHKDSVLNWVLLGGGIWLTARGVIGLVR